ncbi:MAG: DUF4421 domain-containing protein [Bacteroidaceae bacterium]|nr:DUF4421 domain-containing protein [Bacteroidaceae bacterium]
MRNRLFILFLISLTALPLFAGGNLKRAWSSFNRWLEEGQRSGIDTNYVQVPTLNRQVYLGTYAYWQNYKMHMPLYVEDASTIVQGITDPDKYKINAHTWQAEVDLGIDWKGLALELPIPLRNKYLYSFGLAKNGSVWGARFRYKHLNKIDGTCNIGDSIIDRESNVINVFFLEGYYIFKHKKFSLSAGLYADMVQKQSAGSPLIYAGYYHSRYNVSKIFPANYDSFRTNQFCIGGGYAYNFSFLRGRLVLHASLVPMISVHSDLHHIADFDDGEDMSEWAAFYHSADNGKARLNWNLFGRFAVNYSFRHHIVSLLANYRSYGYRNDLKLHIRNQEADIQLNFCTRF